MRSSAIKSLAILSLALNLALGWHLWRIANVLIAERESCIAVAVDLKAQGEAWAAKFRASDRYGRALYEGAYRQQKELSACELRLMRRG